MGPVLRPRRQRIRHLGTCLGTIPPNNQPLPGRLIVRERSSPSRAQIHTRHSLLSFICLSRDQLDFRTAVPRSAGVGPLSIAFTQLLPAIELLLRKISYPQSSILARPAVLA